VPTEAVLPLCEAAGRTHLALAGEYCRPPPGRTSAAHEAAGPTAPTWQPAAFDPAGPHGPCWCMAVVQTGCWLAQDWQAAVLRTPAAGGAQGRNSWELSVTVCRAVWWCLG